MGMARLIDADALSIEVMDASYWDNQDEDVIWNLVQDAPTIDAVPVVRCKECKCAYINSFSAASGVAVCKHWSNEAKTVIVQQDDFCSYGERREDNG